MVNPREPLERCPECNSASRGRTPAMFCQHRWHDTPKDPPPIRSIETRIIADGKPHDLSDEGARSMLRAPRIPTLTASDRADLERREGKSDITLRAEAKALTIIDAQAERIRECERELRLLRAAAGEGCK